MEPNISSETQSKPLTKPDEVSVSPLVEDRKEFVRETFKNIEQSNARFDKNQTQIRTFIDSNGRKTSGNF